MTAKDPIDLAAPSFDNKKWWGGCALVLAGLIAWDQGPLEALYAAVPAVIALALLIVHRARPELVEQFAPWLARGWRVEASLVALIVAAVLRIALHFGFLLVAGGILLLIGEGRKRNEIRHLDPGYAWGSGWGRRILLLSVVLAAFTFSSDFEGEFSSTSYTGEYTYTYTDPSANGYESGDAPKLAVLLVPPVLWLLWRPKNRPEWYRFVPAASLGIAALWMAKIAWDDYRFVQELHEISESYPRYYAAGPVWFLLLLAPGLVVAARYALRGDGSPVPKGAA